MVLICYCSLQATESGHTRWCPAVTGCYGNKQAPLASSSSSADTEPLMIYSLSKACDFHIFSCIFPLLTHSHVGICHCIPSIPGAFRDEHSGTVQ